MPDNTPYEDAPIPFLELEEEMARIKALSKDISTELTSGFKEAVVQGKSLEKIFKTIFLNLSQRLLLQSLNGLSATLRQSFGGAGEAVPLLGQLTSAVLPFARGGVVTQPTFFGMNGGSHFGVMGEAGAEAILPLARGRDGRLGVRAEQTGAATPPITIHITTPNSESFRGSEQQIASTFLRALRRSEGRR